MLTANEIARELGLDVYRVRYRLDVLRAEGKVKWAKKGQTHVYSNDALEKVRAVLDGIKTNS